MATSNINKKRGFGGWTTRDIMTAAVLGLIWGVLVAPLVYLYTFLLGLGPIALWSITGAFFLPAYFLAYSIRRPGAAFLGMLLAGLIQLPFTPAGVAFLISAVMRGIVAEPVFWFITRYKQFDMRRMALVGAIVGLVFFLFFGVLLGTLDLDIGAIFLTGLLTVISTTLGSIIAKVLADAIAARGVLKNTALGQSRYEP